VAVHGFHSPSEGAWKGAKDSSWLKDIAVEKDWNARIIQYCYSSKEITASLYTRKAIRREALMLLEKLAELRRENDHVSSNCNPFPSPCCTVWQSKMHLLTE